MQFATSSVYQSTSLAPTKPPSCTSECERERAPHQCLPDSAAPQNSIRIMNPRSRNLLQQDLRGERRHAVMLERKTPQQMMQTDEMQRSNKNSAESKENNTTTNRTLGHAKGDPRTRSVSSSPHPTITHHHPPHLPKTLQRPCVSIRGIIMLSRPGTAYILRHTTDKRSRSSPSQASNQPSNQPKQFPSFPFPFLIIPTQPRHVTPVPFFPT